MFLSVVIWPTNPKMTIKNVRQDVSRSIQLSLILYLGYVARKCVPSGDQTWQWRKKNYFQVIFLLTPPFGVDFQLPRLLTPEGKEDQGMQFPVATLGRNSKADAASLSSSNCGTTVPFAAPETCREVIAGGVLSLSGVKGK